MPLLVFPRERTLGGANGKRQLGGDGQRKKKLTVWNVGSA
jgi:hypothetical protein